MGNSRGAEWDRLADVGSAWRRWGPYVSERAWGTVREDYSRAGEAWTFFPHDHARSRTYRWNEDGLGGICDDKQILCLGFAFWNGRDPILKERIFGLTGPEGNHGEDAKEYWWYLDATPTHSWMRWRYLYPQSPFPYAELVGENRRRGRSDPEFELADTGVLEKGYWDITVEYAKAAPDDILISLRALNVSNAPAPLEVLPTLWFRNTWAWSFDAERPVITWANGAVVADHRDVGRVQLVGDGVPEPLFCDNETNTERLWGVPGRSDYPKDGINDHVVNGAGTVNPGRTGTKAALRYRLHADPGASTSLRLRLGSMPAIDATFDRIVARRRTEADEFYATLTPGQVSADEAAIMRQAFAGMLWSQQFYHYDVDRWLEGDPGGPSPPPERRQGRNASWSHVNNADVISMPDKWEYPWYAAWDLAFHCIALVHVDPVFSKEQLLLLCREWYMHPNGQLPAYEWALGDVNPPVHAWAALRVFELDGATDYTFLKRVFHKLVINFTWWVNRKDTQGKNVFEGGFLGLDNIGPFDRSAMLPNGGHLDQSDGTAWMAMFCLNLLEIALVLAVHDRTYEDIATKFFEHFVYIATAMNQQGLWDEEASFYHDVLHEPDGTKIPLRARSIVGLIPLCAVTTLSHDTLLRLPDFAARLRWFVESKPQYASSVFLSVGPERRESRLLAIVDPDRLRRILQAVLAEDEFLSPHGLRALSRHHASHPLQVTVGNTSATLDYEPGESTSGIFGGNSNWRGPVWFPVNYLVIEALRAYHRFLGQDWLVEHPAGSGRALHLGGVADDLSTRLIGLFCNDGSGRRPVFGDAALFQNTASLHDAIPFHEYFHGDTGKGLGASHQTGWTGLVADLIMRRGAAQGGYQIVDLAPGSRSGAPPGDQAPAGK